jgi:uncharacterized protein (DUF488 family)
MTTVYTIGHSNHDFDRFLALLRQHSIEAVVDVRSSPYSRYVPQANRETLDRALVEEGIAYLFRGDKLGGKPDGVVGDYEQIEASAAYQDGITEVLALASKQRLTLMCSEGDHRRCHRHLLIAPTLLQREATVIHIEPDGSLVEEKEEPKQLSLF